MARELALHAAALRPRARAAFLPLCVYVEEGRELRGRREFRERGGGEPHPIWCEVLSHHDWSMVWHGPLLGLEIEVRSGVL